MKYRQMGLHEQQLSEDDLVPLMAEEHTFVTRPVIVRGDRLGSREGDRYVAGRLDFSRAQATVPSCGAGTGWTILP